MLNAFRSIFEYREAEYQQFHGLRALAIILVMSAHFRVAILNLDIFSNFNVISGAILQFSEWCVDLFFVLSGFLVSGGLFYAWKNKKPHFFRSFYLKRWIRIVPPYYIFLIFGLIFLLLRIAALQSAPPSALNQQYLDLAIKFKNKYIFDFLFLSNFIKSAQPHSWALALEEQFYLFFPLFGYYFLFKLSSKKRIQILLSLWFLFLIMRTVLTIYAVYAFEHMPLWDTIRTTPFDSLIMGVVVMELFYNYKDTIDRLKGIKAFLLFALSLLIMTAAPVVANLLPSSHLLYLHRSITSLSVGLILLSITVEGSFFARILSARIFRPISRLSYTMYLWHILILTLMFTAVINPRKIEMNYWVYAGLFFSYLLFTFVISIIPYSLFEYPFLKLKEWMKVKKI